MNTYIARKGRADFDNLGRSAAALGTRVHTVAQKVALEREWKPDAPEMQPFAFAIRQFLDTHVDEVLGTEIPMMSQRQGFGGTADMWCRMLDGSHCLVDWKTTRQLTRRHGYQLAAYGLLSLERGMNVQKRMAVRLKKEKPGEFAARSYVEHEGDVAVFRSALALWHALDRQKKRPICGWEPSDVA